MVFSVPDQALMRSRSQTPHTVRAILDAVPLVPVATAQVNQTTYLYPLAQLTVDNVSADWLTKVVPGMGFAIGTSPGGTDVTWGVVRQVPTATIFKLDGKSFGDPGYARNIITPIADNYYVTVYKHRPPWGLLSSIRNGIFYKNFDVTFSGQTLSPDPIVRLGKHRRDFVNSITGLATFAFTADVYAWNKTTSSYLWNVDGGTITVGSVSTQSITVTFPPGFYVVTCTVTDSKGKTRTAYRYVWADSNDKSSANAPFSYRHIIKLGSDRQDANGRSLSFDIYGDLDTNEIYPGQAFLLSVDHKFAGVSLSDQTNLVTSFMGYVPSKTLKLNRKTKVTSIPIESPITAAKGVPSAVQLLTEVLAPKNWTECGTVLSNPVGAAYYCTNYHAPFLLNAHDLQFDPYLLGLRFKGHEFTSRDIQSQLGGVAERFRGNIGCRSDGTIRMVRNPMYLTNAERNALPVQWQWNPTDFTNDYERDVIWRLEVGSVYGYAFSHNGAPESVPYASLAPGRTQAQGVGQEQMTPFIVKSADGQTEVNRITGHHFPFVNASTKALGFDANRNLDVAEPCDLDRWHRTELFARYDPEGVGFSDRAIATGVNRKWSDGGSLRMTPTIEFQVESFGQPGITMPVDRGGANNWPQSNQNPTQVDPYEPAMPELGLDLPVVLAGNSNGALGRSQSIDEATVQWERQ